MHPDDQIDYAVGLSNLVRIGDEVSLGAEVAVVHARTASDADDAKRTVQYMIKVGSTRPKSLALIGEIRRGNA